MHTKMPKTNHRKPIRLEKQVSLYMRQEEVAKLRHLGVAAGLCLAPYVREVLLAHLRGLSTH